MKKIGLLLVAAATLSLSLASCESKKSSTTEEENTVLTEAVAEEVAAPAYVGTYEGTLPCADCSGIKTKLTLRADFTYDLSGEYLEKEDGKFEESGTYELLENDVVMLITPSSNNKTYYKLLDNSVALVADETGTLAEGELADQYILAKTAE